MEIVLASVTHKLAVLIIYMLLWSVWNYQKSLGD